MRNSWRKSAQVGFIGVGCLLAALVAHAQQVRVTTPMQNRGASFSESIGSSWGLSGKNWSLNVGGANAQPVYGGYNANSGLQTGFEFYKGNTRGYFNGWANQSYEGYNTMEAPSVMMMNGQPAIFRDVTDTPFVVSTIPVVGGYQSMPPQVYRTTLDERLDRLNHEKKSVKERPLVERRDTDLRDQAKKKTRERTIATPERDSQPRYSRSTNPDAATTPALSVAEIKKRKAAQKKREE
ncbi:MAG: hypothetical protein Q4D38_08505 [Planctomycetia bacterium]|nr:hypothetical protein [Planctomycetia bacterium]